MFYGSGGGSRMRAMSPSDLNRLVRPTYLRSSRVRSISERISLRSLDRGPKAVSRSCLSRLYFGHSNRKWMTVSFGPSCVAVLQFSHPAEGAAPILFR